jgi:hypothetical protein
MHDLTIIITTSAIPSHPSTDVIDEVIEALVHIKSPNVNITDVYIVCDGYNIRGLDEKPNFKPPKITVEKSADYELYISVLEKKYSQYKIIKRNKRYGFAKNLRYILDMVETTYVLVVQHDWVFRKDVDLDKIMCAMDKSDEIKYVNFMSSSSTNYLNRIFKLKNGFKGHKIDKEQIIKSNKEKFGIDIVPLMFWYDKPHICRTDYYKSFVFGQKHYDSLRDKLIQIRSFVEDSLGNVILNNVKKNGLSAHAAYGTYLYYEEPDAEYVSHSNGRAFITDEQRKVIIEQNKSVC